MRYQFARPLYEQVTEYLEAKSRVSMQPLNHTIDATVSTVASKVTGAGSALTFVGWMTASDFGIYAGIFIGIAGLLVNLFFKYRSDKRSARAHEAFMRKMSFDPNATIAQLRSEDVPEADE